MYITLTAEQEAFTGADAVIMLGAFPRKDGMERKDLLAKNCGIFKEQVCSLYRGTSPKRKLQPPRTPQGS